MLSLALDPQVVASAWERVGGSIFSELGGGQVAHTAINLDLSVVQASLSVQRASSNSPGCTTFSRDLRQPESTNETCTPCSDAATPGTLSCWQSMMQVDLYGSHSHHSGVQQPCTSDGAEVFRVPQTVLDVSDTRLYNSIADLQQSKAPATGTEALVEAGAASKDDASDQIVRPQLSRASSLSGVQPGIPGSPLESSNSGTNSAGSDNSCADLSGSEASAADSTAAAVQETAPTADAALGRTAKAAENKAHLCPKAAMAAATAALQRRLLEQQKMGLLRTPGVPAAVLSVSASAVQPIAQAETQPMQGAVPLGGSASAALPSANVPTAAPKLAGVKGFSAMCWQKPASAATARQLLQHKASVSHAAGVGSVVEPFVRTRAEALARYREKRARRSHAKKIRYHLRKVNADKRPRIKGRFVSKEEMEKMGLLGPSLEAAVDASSVHQQYSAFTGVCDGDHAAATAASGCPWEEQMQHMHLMGADMAAELLFKFDDADHEHEHQLLAVANGSPATFEAVLDGCAAHHAAPGHVLLPPVLEYPVECPLATAGDEEMPQLHMDFPAADGLCLGFHDDFLNDEASEVSNHHHDLLMV